MVQFSSGNMPDFISPLMWPPSSQDIHTNELLDYEGGVEIARQDNARRNMDESAGADIAGRTLKDRTITERKITDLISVY